MIKFFKNLVLDFCYGKRLEVSVRRIKKYKAVEAAFKAFTNDPSMPAVIVTGDSYDRIMRDIPCWLHYMQGDVKDIHHLVIPAVAYQFFLSGGTWKEIDDYNTVLKYGMLHGKKRRL